jgi:Ca2+-dependent lipid-binding protein
MWFVAMALQKLMGCAIACFLHEDWKVKPREPEDVIRFSDVKVSVLQGRGLVAKDKNIWGRHTSSDPHVVSHHGPNDMGKRSTIKKTLDPTWNDQSFRLSVVPGVVAVCNSVKCGIFDHDALSSYDRMGTVFVPIPTQNDSKVMRWCP